MDDDAATSPPGEPSTPAARTETVPVPTPAGPPLRNFFERLPVYVVPLILIGVPVLFGIAAQLAPVEVGDKIVWQYYWGPIHADAAGHAAECLARNGNITIKDSVDACPAGTVGAHSGYTIVNTLSWAVLLGLCILGVAQLLARKKTVMDSKLIIGAVGWVVAGSIFHVLEDVQLFGQPLQYFFITPPIYLLFAAMGVATFIFGHYLKGVAERAGLERALQKLWYIGGVLPVLSYLLLWAPTPTSWSQVNAWVHPIVVAVFALAAFLLASWRFRRIGRIDPSELVGYMSIGWILLAIAYVSKFIGSPWWAPAGGLNPVHQALLAPFLAGAVALVIAGIARGVAGDARRQGHISKWAAYASPINILLVFSQLLDGFATSIGIDTPPHFYNEKHVLSGNIITWTREAGTNLHINVVRDYPTFFGFLPVKLLVSLLVIYAIDVSNPKDAERHPTLIGLVKFAIIMVGLGPGIRDFVRMSLGV